jgi:hypothetical protein
MSELLPYRSLHRGWGSLPACLRVVPLALLIPLFAGTRASASVPFLPAQGSTSPSNGDLNPYGLTVIPGGFPAGAVSPGQLLVSNFNNSAADGNVQGQGSTIVTINPANGQQVGLFFEGSGPIGFTNALVAVSQGFVFAGSVFTTTSNPSAQNGGLMVLNAKGNLVTTILKGTNGPWGLAVNDQGMTAQLFISNVLAGTITRLEVSFKGGFSVIGEPVTIGSQYKFSSDSLGLVIGPAGLYYDAGKDLLYVAAEGDNQIYSIANASERTSTADKGTLVFDDAMRLHGPLGLIAAPNGNLITANADPAAHVDSTQPSELVEFTRNGAFVREFSIDPNTGSAFAILNIKSSQANEFSYVDDTFSNVSILKFDKPSPPAMNNMMP